MFICAEIKQDFKTHTIIFKGLPIKFMLPGFSGTYMSHLIFFKNQ